MGAGTLENDSGRVLETRDLCLEDKAMNATTQTVKTVTTDESTQNTHALDYNSAQPVEVDGGVVVFCDAFARTDDGNALRFDGDRPVATAAVYSERDIRVALADAGYAHDHIEFAIGHRLHDDRALAAARVAEPGTCGHDAELVTDGGTVAAAELHCDYCDETFGDEFERTTHIAREHPDVDLESGQEGAAACDDCDGDASPEVRIVPDPRVGRKREQHVCPRCNDYLTGGEFR